MNRSLSLEQQEIKTLQDVCATIRCPIHSDQSISFINVSKQNDRQYSRCRCAISCQLNQEYDLQISSLHLLLKTQSVQNTAFLELQQTNFAILKKKIIYHLDKKKEEFIKFLNQQYKYIDRIEKDTFNIINSLQEKNQKFTLDYLLQQQNPNINWTTFNEIGDLLSNKIGKNEDKEWVFIEDIFTQSEKDNLIQQISLLELIANNFKIKPDIFPCINILSGHQQTVNQIVISNSEQYFASTSDDSTIKLWDAAQSQLIRTYKQYKGTVLTVAFSNDDKYLISGGEDTQVYIWDRNYDYPKKVQNGHTYSIYHILITNDNSFISCSGDKTIRLWYQQKSKQVNLGVVPNRMALLKSQEWFGIALTNGQVVLINDLNFQENQQIYVDAHPNEDCTDISFSTDGYFITCSNGIIKSKQLKIWQLSREPKNCKVLDLDIQPYQISYSLDNQLIFISSIIDSKIAIYSNYGYKQITKITIPKGYAGQTNIYKNACLAIAKDSSFLLTGGYDNNVKLITLKL